MIEQVSEKVRNNSHLRVQVNLERTGFRDVLLEDIKPFVEENEAVEGYYFFKESYKEDFEEHLQLDLLVKEKDKEVLKQEFESRMDLQTDWENDSKVGWWGVNEAEKEMLMVGHLINAEYRMELLERFREGDIEQSPENFVLRRFHLSMNQVGADYKTELYCSLSRSLHILLVKLIGPNIYSRIVMNEKNPTRDGYSD